jgi:hypothetical protein
MGGMTTQNAISVRGRRKSFGPHTVWAASTVLLA